MRIWGVAEVDLQVGVALEDHTAELLVHLDGPERKALVDAAGVDGEGRDRAFGEPAIRELPDELLELVPVGGEDVHGRERGDSEHPRERAEDARHVGQGGRNSLGAGAATLDEEAAVGAPDVDVGVGGERAADVAVEHVQEEGLAALLQKDLVEANEDTVGGHVFSSRGRHRRRRTSGTASRRAARVASISSAVVWRDRVKRIVPGSAGNPIAANT